ncbi:hypothetical protein EJB05_54156, partial [Eragrostis curvula]
MVQLKEDDELRAAAVPRLIVTGERNQDVKKSHMGYRVKSSTLQDEDRRLVTLDQCLRRRFAGYRLAEAGSTWALRFVTDGLLGPEDDHVRVFRVIAGELSFARDFYYSPLPVASLGTVAAALHFFISFPILVMFCILILPLLVFLFWIVIVDGTHFLSGGDFETFWLVVLSLVLTMVNAGYEIWEMVASVRSNWTKISIIGHYVRWRNRHKPVVIVHKEVKAAILSTFRSSGGQLSDGAAAVRRRCRAFRHDITWACHGGEVTTTTHLILVPFFSKGFFFLPHSVAEGRQHPCCRKLVSLLYLVAEAPDLLPDNSAWTKRRYEKVKKKADELWLTLRWRSHGVPPEAGAYELQVEAFSRETSSHELLNKGSKLGKQLVEEAERPRDGDAAETREDAVW